MPAEMVKCFVCKKERAKSVCAKIRGPQGAAVLMCSDCVQKLSPKMARRIRIT